MHEKAIHNVAVFWGGGEWRRLSGETPYACLDAVGLLGIEATRTGPAQDLQYREFDLTVMMQLVHFSVA